MELSKPVYRTTTNNELTLEKLFFTYFDSDVNIRKYQGERPEVVKNGPPRVVVPGLRGPNVSHSNAPKHVHNDQDHCYQYHLKLRKNVMVR